MPTTILHIGTPKTGTTYLQLAMELNRVRLGEEGWKIPAVGSILLDASGNSGQSIGKTICHHGLAWSLQGERPLPFDIVPIPFDELAHSLSSELGFENSIISSECLYWEVRDIDNIRKLRSAIPGDVKIIIWLRNRWEFIDSMYTQAVYDHGFRQTPGEYVDENRDFFDYGAAISQWSSVFGAENIVIRHYDVLKNPYLSFMDFLELSPDGWVLPTVDVNTSLPKAMVPVLRECGLDRARLLHLADSAKRYSEYFPKVRLLDFDQVASLNGHCRAGDAFLQTLNVEIGGISGAVEYLRNRFFSEITIDDISEAIGLVIGAVM